MPYLLSQKTEGEAIKLDIVIHWQGVDMPVQLTFGPYQSVVVYIAKEEKGDSYQITSESINANFIPPPPSRDEEDV